MKCRRWSDFELQCLYDLANEEDWLETAKRLLPMRTQGQIEWRMAMLRQEAEIDIGAR